MWSEVSKSQPEGSGGQLEGSEVSEGQQQECEVSKGQPEGIVGQLEGLEGCKGQPKGSVGQLEGS